MACHGLLCDGEEVSEDSASFAKEALVEDAEIGGRLGADVVGFGSTGSMSREAGRGFDRAGRANRKENAARVESGEDFVEVKGRFAEPADVRADLSAAFTARDCR